MHFPPRRTILTSLLALALSLPSFSRARADDVEDFYRNKTVTVVIAFSAGGGYDLYARLLARYMGEHLPGKPTIVPQNMPGAGTLKATRYLYDVAPKDGTTFGIFVRSMPLGPVVGLPGATFDSRKFAWLGSMTKDVTLCVTSDQSGIRSWNDALTKDFTVGGEGKGSEPDVFANLIKDVFHVKDRLITGYPGTADMILAVERGELGGFCGVSYSTVIGRWADQLKQGKLHIILQGGLEKHPALPDVPSMIDLPQNDHDRELVRLLLAPQAMARPFTAPPGIPADRLAALRAAFMATMTDPNLLADAKKLQIEVDPMSAADLERLVTEFYAAPKEVTEAARKAFGL